jgi:hypothetical protein
MDARWAILPSLPGTADTPELGDHLLVEVMECRWALQRLAATHHADPSREVPFLNAIKC